MELELTPQNRKRAHDLVDEATVKKGKVMQIISLSKHRSNQQNRLQWLWLNQVVETLQDDTVEGYRAYCKLHKAVPILRAESEKFREVYDRVIRPLTYEQKLELMQSPIDLPVTRELSTKGMAKYLDEVFRHFRGLGVDLQEP